MAMVMIIACSGVTKIELNLHRALQCPGVKNLKRLKKQEKIMQTYAKT